MSVSRILADASLPAEATPLKLGPRKSTDQPQVWSATDGIQPRWVLKFTAPGQLMGATKLEREIQFLKATLRLPDTDPVRGRVADLVAEGLVDGWRYLITEFCNLDHSVPPIDSKSSVTPIMQWLSDKLGWLDVLQSHQRLRAHLSVPDGHVLTHGDFNHYNFLEGRGRVVVLDWEDWSRRPERFLDAVHCAVMPTLIGTTPAERADAFAWFWLDGGAYVDEAWSQLSRFVDGRDLDTTLAEYLSFQLQLLGDGPASIRQVFERCQSRRRGVHAPR